MANNFSSLSAVFSKTYFVVTSKPLVGIAEEKLFCTLPCIVVDAEE